MTIDTVVVALLTPINWAPPGVDRRAWRAALAEDVVDLIAPLPHIEPAIAVVRDDLTLAAAIAWPAMRVYRLEQATLRDALEAASGDGFARAAVICADAPDLPAMLIGKLLRPLTTRSVAVAPALDGAGLLGVAARLPVPAWLPRLDVEVDGVAAVREGAPTLGAVTATPGWYRQRGPEALRRLDPGLEGWPATRALLQPA